MRGDEVGNRFVVVAVDGVVAVVWVELEFVDKEFRLAWLVTDEVVLRARFCGIEDAMDMLAGLKFNGDEDGGKLLLDFCDLPLVSV